MVAQHTLLHWEALAQKLAPAGCSSRLHPKGLLQHEAPTHTQDMKWWRIARNIAYALYRKMTRRTRPPHRHLSTFIRICWTPYSPHDLLVVATTNAEDVALVVAVLNRVDPPGQTSAIASHSMDYDEVLERLASLPCLELVSKSVTGDLLPKEIQGVTLM